MATRNSNQNVIAALIVALLALAGLNIYQFINRNALIDTNKQQETELVSMEKAKTELDKQYYEALSELEEMKSGNEELNEIIETQKADLAKQKTRIGGLLRDSKNLGKAREEMAKMKESADQYLAEIAALREENDQLSSTNLQLNKEKLTLTSDLDSQKAVNEDLTEVKNSLTEENEQLSTEKTQLSRKVDFASAIEVKDIEVKGYKVSESGKESRRRQAENVNMLRLCFDLTDNQVAEDGIESFYIRMITPLGETLTNDRLGSGVMQAGSNGEKMKYTAIKELNYTHEESNICAKWKPGTQFQEGVYNVEIYNKGYIVGKSTFKLK